MKKNLLLVPLILFAFQVYAQELTLDSCQNLARKNHPLLRQAGIIDQLSELRQQNIETNSLPQFDLVAKASWQSDVTKLALKLPPSIALPTPPSKDQYKTYVELKQRIYDGGVTKKSKEVEEADRLISKQQNETELYKIKETVNTLYFNALIIQQQLEIVNLKRSTIAEQIKQVESAVANGVSLPNNLDQLRAENIMTDQQEIELKSTSQTINGLLEIITGQTITDKTTYNKPLQATIDLNLESNRPELTLFTLQQAKLSKSEELLKNSRNPFIYAFGQGGYGRPGLNMLDNNFADFYVIGAGLSWNMWDWHKSKRERYALKLQKDLVQINSENFNRSIHLQLKQEENNAKKISQLIGSDEQLVEIKTKILDRSASALKNGVITSADYLRDLNSSLQAKANLETHKIQFAQTSINYLTIKGNKQ
ncbi:MAG: TolC family protein [Bacteroidia bacterium]|nr:TolC family protein [Bacteroidia bacterium]